MFSLTGWSPRIRPGFLVSRLTQVPAVHPPRFSRTGLSPAAASLSRLFQPLRLTSAVRSGDGPTTPREALPPPRFGLLRVRSPLLAQSLVCFLFLRVLRCFSSPGSPPSSMDAGLTPGGLPHSEIRGCAGICPSPRLIAACHVLLRLREPRHPSCALLSFPCNVIYTEDPLKAWPRSHLLQSR